MGHLGAVWGEQNFDQRVVGILLAILGRLGTVLGEQNLDQRVAEILLAISGRSWAILGRSHGTKVGPNLSPSEPKSATVGPSWPEASILIRFGEPPGPRKAMNFIEPSSKTTVLQLPAGSSYSNPLGHPLGALLATR